MLKSLIILGAWITPGVVLFLYLLWIGNRGESPGGELQTQTTRSAASQVAEGDSAESELAKPVAAPPGPRKTLQ